MTNSEQIWRKSWDPGIDDLDPKLWERSLVEVFRTTIEKYPGKTALAFMGRELSFKEADLLSNRFANMLVANGVKKGDTVGINLPNIPEYVIAWLGSLKAGCAVSGVSPLLSTEEMQYQLLDSDAVCLVTLDAIFAARLTKIADSLPKLKVVAAAGIGGFMPPLKSRCQPPSFSPYWLALCSSSMNT